MPAPIRACRLLVDEDDVAGTAAVAISFGKRIAVGAANDWLASRTPSGCFIGTPEGVEVAFHLIGHCHWRRMIGE